jgi:hypothetical protein
MNFVGTGFVVHPDHARRPRVTPVAWVVRECVRHPSFGEERSMLNPG